MISISIKPESNADNEKLGEALHRLADEDPTFTVAYDEETNETIISGMGELHLEIIVAACAANSAWWPKSAARKWLTAKRQPPFPKVPTNTPSNQGCVRGQSRVHCLS